MARALPAAAIAALLTGVVDSLLTLASNPDPVAFSYRASYAVGPLLLALAWGLPVGLGAGALGVSGATPVVAVWLASMIIDAVRAGQGWPAVAVLFIGCAIGAVAIARLAIDLASALERRSRTRRRLLWAGGVLALGVATAATMPASLTSFGGGTGPCAEPRTRPAGPNLLLITVDALRFDAARQMQSYKRLAASGIEFTQHLTVSPWTLPSIASLLTGRPLFDHDAGTSLSTRSLLAKAPLRSDTTLASVLGAHGYRTHAIVTNPFLTARYGVDAGFCSFENVTMAGEAVRGMSQTTVLRSLRAIAPAVLPDDRANTLRAHAEDWLAAEGPEPFFLWLHFLDPHAPYGDRDGASTSLALDLMAFQETAGPQAPFRATGRLRAGEYRPDAEERAWIASLYREDVAFADREIARLFDLLAARNLLERTVIVFSADHGEEFWDHGGVEHGRTLYDEVLHVPFVVRPAGGSAPAVRRDLTGMPDVAATIVALLAVHAPELRGTNLLLGPAPGGAALVLGRLLFGEEWEGLRTEAFKYVRSETGEERVFDLLRDPDERVNGVAAMTESAAAGRARLGPWAARRY